MYFISLFIILIILQFIEVKVISREGLFDAIVHVSYSHIRCRWVREALPKLFLQHHSASGQVILLNELEVGNVQVRILV